jgi:hypothetical protein
MQWTDFDMIIWWRLLLISAACFAVFIWQHQQLAFTSWESRGINRANAPEYCYTMHTFPLFCRSPSPQYLQWFFIHHLHFLCPYGTCAYYFSCSGAAFISHLLFLVSFLKAPDFHDHHVHFMQSVWSRLIRARTLATSLSFTIWQSAYCLRLPKRKQVCNVHLRT